MLESLTKDIRFGIRQLRKSPGFTIVAVFSLALGLGANMAIFQLVNAIRLKSLPVEKPQELATINFQRGSRRSGWWSSRSAQFTYGQLREIRARQEAFTGVLAWSATRFNLANGGEARYAEGLYVSGDFFQLLGVTPYLGRTFVADDDDEGCGHVGAVISNAFWQREFGSDPGVVGRNISIDGHQIPIIGVTGPAFFGVEVGNRFDVAIPLCADRLLADGGRSRIPIAHAWWLSLMGRLKPGWTSERATAHLVTISPGIMQATLPPMYKPDTAKGYLANKLESNIGGTGVSGLRREYERSLWLLMATTGLVLLIACANLANLLLARASIREREVAVRLAVGASRWRLVRQFLVESLLLAIGGAALGALLAQFVSRGLIASITTSNRPLFVGLGLDLKVMGFMTGLAIVTCLLFGLVPALRATGLELAASIRSGGRSMTAGREGFSLRRTLVALQIALSLVLLVGALLFVRSLRNLMTTDAGFKGEGVITVNIDFSKAKYPKERRLPVMQELNEKLAGLPGVVSAAQTGFTPVSGSGWDNSIGPDGEVAAASGKESFFNRASPGYFRTMGTALVAGRDFDDHDTLTSPKVAIVNEKFAREFFGGKNPVGHTFHLEQEAGKPEPLIQIVGLVKNTKYYELREDFRPIGYFPIAQDDDPSNDASYVLRVAGSPSALMNSIKAAVASVNPTMGLQFQSFSEQLKESLLREQLMARLSGAFGLLAALLATMGLYGVIAYMVARRRNEIGVRIALGADRKRVIGLVLREALLLLAVGLPVGIIMAVLAGRAAAALLYGLQPYDPISLIAATCLLAVVALAASYGPARRAAAVEPMVALRSE
jgi:predicted permease